MANYDMDKLVLAGFDGEHVDDTFTMEGVKIDNTLSVTGRAADAKKTGDEIGALKEDLNDIDVELYAKENVANWVDVKVDATKVTGKFIHASDAEPTTAGSTSEDAIHGDRRPPA